MGGLAELAPLGALRALRLASLERVATLDGIEALALEELELARLTTPRSVAPVARLGALRVLSLSGARQLADLERVGEVGSLERLYIDRGPALASLAWMRGLERLRDAGFWRTRIRDGDLGVLLELPRLERVRALTPHLPHYSHTAEDLSALLRLVWPDTPMAAAEAERERRARSLTARGTSS